MGHRFGLILLAALSACGPAKPSAPPGPPPVPLHLAPACDLVPAAGLEWLVEAKPRAIAQSVDLIPAIATVIPEERFALFAASHGGVDLRQMEDLCVARYRNATLSVGRMPIDPNKVLAAFDERSSKPPVRTTITPNPPVVRSAGSWKEEPQAVTVFGREALAFEQGKPGAPPTVIRIAEAYALGKLKRAPSALHGARTRARGGRRRRCADARVRARSVHGRDGPGARRAPSREHGDRDRCDSRSRDAADRRAPRAHRSVG
jgi:hypothetical protein